MTRRPQRLIRLAQQLAVALGLDIDQDSEHMTEEDLRELLNAALDYVDHAEDYRNRQSASPLMQLPGIWNSSGPYQVQTGPTSSSATTYRRSYSPGELMAMNVEP